MLNVFAHADLPHHSILVPINACKLTQMGIHVLQSVSQLEGVHISKPILNVTVNNKLNNPKNLSTKVKSITKS